MKIAVLTLTRDRAEYTRHCFDLLRANAGVDFDHYVLDQGSTDHSREVIAEYRPYQSIFLSRNIGVTPGLNKLLDRATESKRYDVFVKFDNDCELLDEGTLLAAAKIVYRNPGWVISPRILGLNDPPAVISDGILSGYHVGRVFALGGIFMAVHSYVYVANGYRYNEANPAYGNDDVDLSAWVRSRSGACGYLLDYEANHYLTTKGQRLDLPEYFQRKDYEFSSGKTASELEESVS